MYAALIKIHVRQYKLVEHGITLHNTLWSLSMIRYRSSVSEIVNSYFKWLILDNLEVVWLIKVFKLETGFICLAYSHYKLQVFNSYHCLDHSQATHNLHSSGAGLPFNLPASAADIRSLGFNWSVFSPSISSSIYLPLSSNDDLELSAATGVSQRNPLLLMFLFLYPVLYRRFMLQQAGYQRSSIFIVPGAQPQKHAFRNTSPCSLLKALRSE
jgi:hypothetical protein